MSNSESRLTLEQIAARFRQDALDNPKHVLQSVQWLRTHGDRPYPERYQFEVNFNDALDSHWLNLRNHSRVRTTTELVQFSHDSNGNRPTLEQLEEMIDRIVEVIGEDKIQRPFFERMMQMRAESKEFATRSWKQLYGNMRRNGLTLMQMAVAQVVWNQAALDHDRIKSQITPEEAKLNKIKELDPLGFSAQLRQLNKEKNEIIKKLEPAEIQLQKYKELVNGFHSSLSLIDTEVAEIEREMEKLTKEERDSTFALAFSQSGRKPKQGIRMDFTD